MTPEEATAFVRKNYDFTGITDELVSGAITVAETAQTYLDSGAKILDFGAGRCGKTAVLQTLGFQCTAYDDLQDDWHKIDDNRDQILSYAEEVGIDFCIADGGPFPFEKGTFDMIMLHDVMEHLHSSPRDLLNDLLEYASPNGYLFVTVPNAVNIRKRIAVIRGKTNLPDYDSYYWSPDPWRGHIREYVKDDLLQLSKLLGLQVVELRSCHHMLQKVSPIARRAYLATTSIFPGWRDTWLLVARKPVGWKPNKHEKRILV